MLWSNECKVQGKNVKSHLEKSPTALSYSRIVEGVTESKTEIFHVSDIEKTASYISELDTVKQSYMGPPIYNRIVN